MLSKRSLVWFGLLVLISVGIWRANIGLAYRFSHAPTPKIQALPSGLATSTVVTSVTTTNATVGRVVDGDTIKVRQDGEGDETTIRFLGINTPESVDPRRPVECFGHEASAYTASHLEGKRIRLDPDFEADNIDKYGRFLRNIVLEDGTDFNAKLVQEGYAYAYLSFPLNRQRKTQLRHLQEEAQAAARGLWNPKTCNGQK